MNRYFTLFLVCLFSSVTSLAQVVSGPMLGQVELRDAKVWLEVAPSVKSVQLIYNKKGETARTQTIAYKGQLGNTFNPLLFTIGGLQPNTTYQYRFTIDGKPTKQTGEFTTKELWQWRKPAPDFSFITGSCAYFNEPPYDRPGKPYGGDSSIFETMTREKAAFMLWLGDNWYTREVDYYSAWGLWNRAHHDRKMPVLQPLLKAMPHYATWDDHDYGPNDIGSHFVLKEESKKVFDAYWANPSSGRAGQGVYTQLTYGDVDIFLCDDRWWRSADETRDSVNGHPNPEKVMLGAEQMQWLKNSMLYSQATFKLVVVGSQVLNPVSPFDKLRDFRAEYNELIDFLDESKVEGVVFVTGDRHHSEIIKVDRPGSYPLFDITVSPLTSGTHVFGAAEKNNPYRVVGIDQKQNYGRFSFSGPKGQRKLTVEFLGIKGEKLGEWSVGETSLKVPKQGVVAEH
jgi:alkaline phosphatase D